MKIKQLHTVLVASICAAFAACSDYDVTDTNNPDAGKSPIELSVGDDSSPISRAVVIDGRGRITAFEKDTRLHLLMISHDKTKAKTETSTDKYTETYGEAKGSNTSVPDLDNDPAQWSDAQKESAVSFESGKGIKRYWDDAHGRESMLSIYGFANVWAIQPTGSPWYPRLDRTAEPGTETGTETNTFPATWKNTNANIGTFVGGSIDATYNPKGKWIVGDFTPNNNKKYQEQTKTSILSKDDICYSNNLADYSGNTSLPEAERTDNRPHFDASATPKHFTGGTMVFRRAMCLFTFKVYMGAGFSESEFKFKDGTNIAMKGFNKKGFLNIKDGEWTASSIEVGVDATYEGATGYSWSKIDLTNEDKTDKSMDSDAGGKYWQLLAFAIPGTDISTSTVADALTMNINGNVYKVSMKQLYDAIAANDDNCVSHGGAVKTDYLTGGTKLKAGINYEFSFTIGKTAISNITAKVVDWETVKATHSPTNARIEIDVEDDRGAEGATPIMLYRAHNDADVITDDWEHYEWEKGYNDNVTLTYNSETHKYAMPEGTEWYWENNMTYYHFRTVQPSTMTVYPTENKTSEDNYITLTSSASGITEANDVKWGAPFKDLAEEPKVKFKYDFSKGFDVNMGTGNAHQIYKAIGPTTAKITIIPFHMMSDVTIKLKTVEGNKAVTLTGATVNIVGAYATGKVLMGNGNIIGTGDKTTEGGTNSSITYNSSADGKYIYKYGAVPQDLENVSLVIQTSDHNRYIVPMASIFTTTEPSTNNINNPYQINNGKYYIDKWYPGFKYEYELELSKTGINNFRATIVNWETVTVNQGGITIQ